MKYFYNLILSLLFVFGPSSVLAHNIDTDDEIEAVQVGSLVITGYVDATCPNDNGRTLEVYVNGSVDLNAWTVEVQNDGNGFNDVIDLSSLGTITNDFIYITNDANTLNAEFGITNNVIVNTSVESDGNEAFQVKDASSNVIDRFGVENVDGSGTAWEHQNTFFYRNDGALANGGNFLTGNWDFGNVNELNGQGTCNGASGFSNTVPFGDYLANTSKVQIIHNSADPNLQFVDIYLDGNKVFDDVEFRTATDFTSINAGTPIDIDIAPQNSSSVADSFYSLTTTLTNNEKYILVANGVQDPSNFDETVNSPIDFELSVFQGAREEAQAISGNTDILIHHGSTDGPTLDFVETIIPAGLIANDLTYTDFTNYIQIATGDYRIEVKNQDGQSVINTYDAPLANLNLQNKAVTILASGFFDPSDNQSGEEIGLWLAEPEGGALTELPLISSCTEEVAPFVESFESNDWQIGSGLGNTNDQIDLCWERIPENDGNNYTWSVTDNETGSTGTGPNSGFDGGKYVYTEGSSGSFGDEAIFKTPLINTSNLNDPALEFSYFMNGSDIQQLTVEAKGANQSTWNQLLTVSGPQQSSGDDNWITEELDLAGISSSVMEIRFVAVRGSGFQSDVAIDAIKVQELTTCESPSNLTASNITDDSVSLSWDDVADATSGYNWYVYDSGDSPGSSTPVANGSTSAGTTSTAVSSLNSSTTYDAYVESDCGATDGISNLSNVVTFTTDACAAADQCDYTFTLSSNFGNGWFGTTFDVIQDGVTIATLGENFNNGSSQVATVTLCKNANIELFWNDDGGFDDNVGISITNPFGDEIYDKPFGTGSAGTTVFTFTANCTPPTCPEPVNLIANVLSATSVNLSWDVVNQASNGYQWEVYNEGDNPQTASPVQNGTTSQGVTNVDVTGLSGNTGYDAYIIADCDTEGFSDLSNKVSFLTPCATITTPWVESFDSASWVSGGGFDNDNDQIDSCWSRNPENTGNDYFWGTGTDETTSSNTGPGDDVTGGGNYIYAEASGTGNGEQAIITSPFVDISDLTDPFLFYNVFLYGSINSLTVEVKPSTAITWTEVATFNDQIQDDVDDEWSAQNLDLSSFSDQTIQVRFVAISSGNFDGDMAIDQVSIEEAPSCLNPNGLEVTNVGDTTADLSWNQNSTATNGFIYEIYLQGDDPDTNSPVASGTASAGSTTVTASGLIASTAYDAYLRSDCGTQDGLSDLIGPVPFSTSACDASNTCAYEFLLTDSFGDGWNGAEVDVLQNGVLIETLGPSFANGDQFTVNLNLCDDTSVELFWSDGGQFASEVGLSVTDPFGDDLYTLNPGSETPNSTLTTFTVDCDPPAGCFPPTDLTSSNLTVTSADLNWTAFDNAFGGYDWFLFNAGDDPLNTTPIANGNTGQDDTSVSITNLSESTSYDFYIRSDCGIVGVSDLAGPVTFTTPCGIFDTPYAENFDGSIWQEGTGFQNNGDQIDDCWSRDPDTSGNFFWGVGQGNQTGDTGPTGDFTGVNYIYSVGAGGSNGSVANFVSPRLDLSNLSTPSIQFKYFMYGEDIDQLEVQVKEVSDTNWTSLLTISGEQQTSQDDGWENEFLDISSFAGQTVEVRFIATRGASFRSEIALDDLKIDELPSCITPDDLSVSNVSNVSADFDWSGINNAANGYQVDVYLENDDPSTDTPVASSNVGNGVTSTTVSGLANSTNYKAYVFADCGGVDGVSDLSLPVFFITDGCVPADQCDYTFELQDDFGDGWNGNTIDIIQNGVTITTLGENFTDGSNQTVSVSICDNASIEIYWNPGGQFANEVGLTVTNPFDQEIYNKPFDTGSPDSSLFTFTSSCSPPPCDVPDNFTADNIQQTSVLLDWDESANASQGYDWSIFLAGDDPQNDTPVTSGSNAFGVTQVSVSGLSPGTDYEAYIEADCDFDVSGLSNPLSFTTVDVCDVPTNLSVDNIQQTTANLNWDEVADATNGYNWFVFAAGDDPQNDTPVANGTSDFGITSVSVSGLSAGTDYEAYVQADCNFDISDLSNPLSFTTLDFCDVPSNLSVDNVQQTTADLNWDEVTDATNGYNWFVFAAGDDPQNDTPVANGTSNFGTTSVSVSGLSAGTDYEAYVQADCNFDVSDLSNPVSFTTLDVCDTPTNLTVDNIQQTTADLNWDEVTDATNGYNWFVFAAGDDPQNDTPIANGTSDFGNTSVSVSGLSAGTDYEAYVQADCDFDISDLSNPVSFTTITNNCDTPVNLAATNVQQTTADLNWDEVADATNGYNWFVFAAGDDPQNDTPVANGTSDFGNTSVSVSGLSAGTDYEAYVQADCNFDISDLSGAVSFTTLGTNTPTNDALCNSISLSIGEASDGTEFTNVNASVQNNEPQASCFTDGISNTVWFDFTAPSSGNITVTTDFANASLTDTQIAVYETDGTCNDLSALVELTCVTDGGSISNDNAELSLNGLDPGQTYYVQVDQGAGSASGTFGVQVNETLSDTSFDKVTFDHYPNPVTSRLTIKSSIEFEKVTILDMNGRSIKTKEVNATQGEIDMSSLQAGVYFLHLEAKGTSKVLRVIKK